MKRRGACYYFSMQEMGKRSVVKTLSWRLVATGTTLIVAYALTGSIGKASGIAITAALVLMLMYYFHERAWDKIDWGRK